MQNNNEIGMLSVKELNIVLDKLQKGQPIPPLGTFSEVDIVFIAGLFLWYMQHKGNWTKIPIDFKLTDSGDIWNHSHYFKQIFELYNVRHSDIFSNFLYAGNQDANSFSRFFAPPISITKKSIDCFFGEKPNPRINNLKGKYIQHFDIADFVDEKFNIYKEHKQKFDNYSEEILEKLEKKPPVFVFIFIISCMRLAKKEKRDFQETKNYIDKIWQFTQTYTNGLHELAKNIVEHSGQGENNGQGMITIRAYSEKRIDNKKTKGSMEIKDLETHVFDFGTLGIIPKLKKYTDKQIEAYEKNGKLSKNQEKIKNAYVKDSRIHLNENFTLTDFIKEKKLEQQNFRHIGHFGINKLYKFLEYPFEGDMFISSKGINGKNEYFSENMINPALDNGTHYFISIPFKKENFNKIKSDYNQQEFYTLGSSDTLQELMQREVKHIQLEQLNSVNFDEFTGILNITINKKIDKYFLYNIDIYFERLSYYGNKFVVALNLENCFDSESDLLRFLGCLSFEYEQSFIVYNLEFETYKKMIDDNKAFAETRKWEDFWHEKNAILVYSKTKKQNFYFADILFGKNSEDYYSVNKRLNHTFPNSVSLIDKEIKKTSYVGNISLPDFFNNNALLPYDILLKNKNNELALFNIKAILQNRLLLNKFNLKDNNFNSPLELLENYVDNFDGYHILNTHFKIGAKLHTEDYFYAKRLFQNSFYTARLAMLIAQKIKNDFKIETSEKIILIGYEMYSELILSLISKFLNVNGYKNIKHFVGIDNEGKFYFKPNDKDDIFWINPDTKRLEKCTAIIIVPIASTGSTAVKIKEALIIKAEEIIKTGINKSEKANNNFEIEKQVKSINFSPELTENSKKEKKDYVINIILAQDKVKSEIIPEMKNLIKENNEKQEYLIKLKANWYLPDKCKYCGFDEDGNCNFSETSALFGTDKSYLTPTLIFDFPKGKKVNHNIKSVDFNQVNFKNSLKYKSVIRNNEFFLFSVNSPRFIKENEDKVKEWLESLNKEFYNTNENLKINSTDQIILLAPCHETNSEFLNLINEYVFKSSATIIHHQIDIDYIDNFKLLNKQLLDNKNDEDIKVFYVDDNLISGKSFFDIYHLFCDTIEGTNELTGAILLRDSSTQIIHDRFLKAVNHCRTFVVYNLPPSFRLDSKKPLEHERKRYADLRKFALHDVLIKTFDEKEQGLNIGNDKKEKIKIVNELSEEERKAREKEREVKKEISKERHFKMFKTTHKIYDFYTSENNTNNIIKDLLIYCYGKDDAEKTDNKIILLKVLSQYPFILYEPLKKETFNWHKSWLNDKIKMFNEKLNILTNDNKNILYDESEKYNKQIFSFDDFCELKFLIRRAIFLDNLQIIDTDFLSILPNVFNYIEKGQIRKFEEELFGYRQNEYSYKKNDKLKDIPNIDIINNLGFLGYDNLKDFQINLIRYYLELAHKNGWAAVNLLKNIKEIESEFITDSARRFIRMLSIELTAVVNEFYNIIISQYDEEWRNIYNDDKENLKEETDKIEKFIDNEKLKETNKYLIAAKILNENILNSVNTIEYKKFINFLWIKQLIHADTYPKSDLLKNINYIEKINIILEKMKSFFTDETVQVFFVVTDGQQTPYVMNDNEYVLHDFQNEYLRHKEQLNDSQYSEIIKFLYGEKDYQRIAHKTTAEFRFDDKNKKWIDCYDSKNNDIKLNFMKEPKKWLYLIRISELENDYFKTLGLLGFYSEENLYDIPDNLFAKQIIMLLRQDIGKIIIKHHKNDEFRIWAKNEEIRKLYERRFEKFNHNAIRYIGEKTENVRKFNDTLALFAMNQLVFGHVLLGNLYANYLKEINKLEIIIADPNSDIIAFTEENKKYIIDLIQGLKNIYSGKNELFVKYEISISNYDKAKTEIMFDDLKVILIELISNALSYDSGDDNKIMIDFEENRIIFRSKTSAQSDEEKIRGLYDQITDRYPKVGIGLFIINKIVYSVLKKNIIINFDKQKKEFEVIVPINKRDGV